MNFQQSQRRTSLGASLLVWNDSFFTDWSRPPKDLYLRSTEHLALQASFLQQKTSLISNSKRSQPALNLENWISFWKFTSVDRSHVDINFTMRGTNKICVFSAIENGRQKSEWGGEHKPWLQTANLLLKAKKNSRWGERYARTHISWKRVINVENGKFSHKDFRFSCESRIGEHQKAQGHSLGILLMALNGRSTRMVLIAVRLRSFVLGKYSSELQTSRIRWTSN